MFNNRNILTKNLYKVKLEEELLKKVSVRTVEKNLYYIYLIAEFIVVVNVNKSINLRKDMN